MSKKIKLDKYHYHELLDRTYLLAKSIDDNLSSHPVSKKHKEIKKKLDKASKLLYEVYNDISDLK